MLHERTLHEEEFAGGDVWEIMDEEYRKGELRYVLTEYGRRG